MEVRVGNDFEYALKLFKRRVLNDGILKQVGLKEFYLSRREKRKVKDRSAARRKAKLEKKRSLREIEFNRRFV